MRLTTWLMIIPSAFFAINANCASSIKNEIIQLPNCLATQITVPYDKLAHNQEYSVIRLPAEQLEAIVLLADKANCGRFVNVSHRFRKVMSPEEVTAKANALLTVPERSRALAAKTSYTIHHQTVVEEQLKQVNTDKILATLKHLTRYKNRSATLQSGVDAIHWIDQQFNSLGINSERTDIKSFYVNTGPLYKQPSLVTVIGDDLTEPGIVIGAHIDTLDGKMPGAGDDGSGSASLMEIARILLSNNTHYRRPIYLIWYAAEERGLVGSQHVVRYFKNAGLSVDAVMQLDMTGYRHQDDPTIWLYRDYTDNSLTDFVGELVKTYVNVPVADSKCGYGCSDHASWDLLGIPAVFPTETSYADHNPNIHTSADTMDKLSPEHMTNFAKLGLAFALELALPQA